MTHHDKALAKAALAYARALGWRPPADQDPLRDGPGLVHDRSDAAEDRTTARAARCCPKGTSPHDVGQSSAYEFVQERAVLVASRHPHVQHVVRHISSGLYYACVYEMRLDDSDADQPAYWRQVFPRPSLEFEP